MDGLGRYFSMAIFRLPLMLNPAISFYKLMGCGKNGSFDKTPDLRQWALLTVRKAEIPEIHLDQDLSKYYGPFIRGWWTLFGCECWTILLEPIEGHGSWDGKQAFGPLPKTVNMPARSPSSPGPPSGSINLVHFGAMWTRYPNR